MAENKGEPKSYDLVFIGHITFDDVESGEGSGRNLPGGAPLFGATAAALSNKDIAVVTRMSAGDERILAPLKAAGIDVYLQDAPETTHMRVVHPSNNIDERIMYQTTNAGFFTPEEMPAIEPCLVHLGALTDREFTVEFMQHLKKNSYRLSLDMQSFVRQVERTTGMIRFADVPLKKEIAALVDTVKLDIVEAKILTGTDDLVEAAAIVEDWGIRETLITRSDGALVRNDGITFFEKYVNRNSSGRTGRGDTTMGAYLSWRIDHDIHESLRFAAALTSIKMETPGPFRGTLKDVFAIMNAS